MNLCSGLVLEDQIRNWEVYEDPPYAQTNASQGTRPRIDDRWSHCAVVQETDFLGFKKSEYRYINGQSF